MAALERELANRFEPEGYTDLALIRNEIVGLFRFVFTSAIVVGLDNTGYRCRYCYPTMTDARRALEEWKEKRGHEPEGFIKRK